jgi:Type II CAAX prenyl endopeptidase Rce1-like
MNIDSLTSFPTITDYKMAVRYGLLFSVLTILAGFLTGELIDWYGFQPSRDFTAESGISLASLLLMAIFFFPLFETLLYQFLVIEIIGSHTYPRLATAMGVSTLLFSLSHLSPEGSRQAVITLVTGSMLSYIYIRVSRYSAGLAFAMTFTTHMAHNLIVSSIILATNYHCPGYDC